jgi:flagellar motor component MotA
METARLQNRSGPQVIWQAIAMALVCILLGVAIAVGLTLLGRIL